MKPLPKDRCFDDIANKFHRNIYGSTKGRLRHQLLLGYLQQHLGLEQGPLKVLDAGGGTGMMSESLLELGHCVTLSDISGDVLQMAEQRLGYHSHFTTLHTDILSLEASNTFDLIVCHAVLEWLPEPYPVVEKLLSLLAPGGHLSLSFFNRDAQLFGNMCYGNFDYVEKGMQTKNRVRLTPTFPLQPKAVLEQLQHYPINIIHRGGIRCFHDYMKDAEKQASQYDALLRLEREYGIAEPYMWLGKYFHVIASKAE